MKNKRNRKMIYKCIKLIKTYKINILIRISDRKTLYIKVDQKNITNTDTLSVCLPHPPGASNIDIPPSGLSAGNFPVPITVARIEKLCISKLLRTVQRLRIRYLYSHRTPLTYRTSNPPL